MDKLKEFNVIYRCEVKRSATIFARNEKEAKSKFDLGDIEDETDIDCLDIDDVCINEVG